MEANNIGYLKMVIGPMFAGKTINLLSEATWMADLDMKCLYINFIGDNRETENGDETFTTHSSLITVISKKIDKIKVQYLKNVDISNHQIICVDEAQFFEDLYDTVCYWVNNLNKYVIVSGLDGDYKMLPYEEILKLIPVADTVVKKLSKCKICISEDKSVRRDARNIPDAPFTKRITASEDRVLVGGKLDYIAVCRYHFLN